MALIKCPECQQNISSSAKNCPHCGYKITLHKCPECGEFKLAHRVCGHCGYYNGVKVKDVK